MKLEGGGRGGGGLEGFGWVMPTSVGGAPIKPVTQVQLAWFECGARIRP